MVDGGINKGIIKIIPILKKEFKDEFDKIDELGGKVDCLEDYLKTSLKTYKQEKHGIENENKIFKDAIVKKDFKTQEQIRKFYEETHN
jgi:ferritin